MSETTNIEVIEKKPYTLRDLKAEDVFPMTTIISKIGIKEFKSCFESEEVKKIIADKDRNLDEIGLSIFIDMAGIVLANIANAKKEIYAFLSGLSGMSINDIADLDMIVFAEMIIDVFKKDQFKDFMKVVSKLFK